MPVIDRTHFEQLYYIKEDEQKSNYIFLLDICEEACTYLRPFSATNQRLFSQDVLEAIDSIARDVCLTDLRLALHTKNRDTIAREIRRFIQYIQFLRFHFKKTI